MVSFISTKWYVNEATTRQELYSRLEISNVYEDMKWSCRSFLISNF